MYIVTLTADGWVLSNGFRIFRLDQPFAFLFDRRKNPRMVNLVLPPLDIFKGPYGSRYSIRLNKDIVARLYPKRAGGFRCQALYKTSSALSDAMALILFVSKSLTFIVDNLDDSTVVPFEIHRFLGKLIRLVFRSYAFEKLYTDSESLHRLCTNLGIETQLISWNLLRCGEGLSLDVVRILKPIMYMHKKIPLNVLDHRILRDIEIEDTDINDKVFAGVKDYMFLTSINNYFAGFFRELCVSKFGGRQVLPVILFSIS